MEPLDLCVRPCMCHICKRRFWTPKELEHHIMSNHGSRPSFALYNLMFGYNQNMDLKTLLVSQERNPVFNLSSNTGHKGLDQIPKPKSIRKGKKNSLRGRKKQSSYFSRSRFSSDSAHSDIFQSYNKLSTSRNISLAQRDKSNQVLYLPNILSNELNHQPQNSENLLHQGPFQGINNSNLTSDLHTSIIQGSQTLLSSGDSFNQEQNQLYQKSPVTLLSELVQIIKNTESIKENISLTHIYKNNKTSNSPSIVDLNLPLQNSTYSSLAIPEKTTSNQTVSLPSLIVGENSNSYSQSVSVNQKGNQLPKITIPSFKGLVPRLDKMQFSANTSHTRNDVRNQISILRNALFNEEKNKMSPNSSYSLQQKSVKFQSKTTKSLSKSILHTLVVGDNRTPISPNVLFNPELNKMSQNSNDSLFTKSDKNQPNKTKSFSTSKTSSSPSVLPSQGPNQMSKNTSVSLPPISPKSLFNLELNRMQRNCSNCLLPRSVKIPPNKAQSFSNNIFHSLGVRENTVLYSPSVLFNQGPNHLSNTGSVPFPTKQYKLDNTVSTTKNTHMQIFESDCRTNPIPYSSNFPHPKPSNLHHQNSSTLFVPTNPGLIPMRDNNTLIQANNSYSWTFLDDHISDSLSVPFNHETS